MAMLSNVTLTISDVTGWDIEDVAALTRWLNAYANLMGEHQEEKAINCVKATLAIEGEFPVTNIEQWFRTVLSLIFYDLVMLLRQNGQIKDTNLERIEKRFLLSIQRTARRLNNCFDAIDFEQDRDGILRQAERLLKKA